MEGEIMTNIKECPVCGYKNIIQTDRLSKGERYFCTECEAFLKRESLTNLNVTKILELKLAHIIENIKHVPHNKILWNEKIDKYVANTEKYLALYEMDDIKNDYRKDIADKLKSFIHVCSSADFQIAFVGTIKTGKSTLINALLGNNYASMAVTPETAALTKFRSSNKDYVKVSFYSKDEWEQLWSTVSSEADAFLSEYNALNGDKYKDDWIDHIPINKEVPNKDIQEELKRWSSSKSPEHYFVKEIEVGISTLSKDFPEQVVFVDTPGLSDPVTYRSDITKAYIKQANAVFVCIDAQKMYKEEIETISSVFSFSYKNKNKVHIIATHWDNLNDPIKDWKEQYKYMLRMLVGKTFFDSSETAESNIMYSSAYIYNLCRDYDPLDSSAKRSLRKFAFNFEDEIDPTELDGCIDFLKRVTNIDRIKEVIREHLISNYEDILNKDIGVRYEDILNNLKRTIREAKANAQDVIATSSADVEKMIEKIETQRKDYEGIFKCKEDLAKTLYEIEKSTYINMENILKKIGGNVTPPHKPQYNPPQKPRGNFLDRAIKKFFK